MYTVTRAARMRMGWLASDAWKACAVPWKLAWMEGGMFICRSAACMRVTASPRDTPGARLNDSVTAGKKPWWFTASGVVLSAEWGEVGRGSCLPVVDLTLIALRASGFCWSFGGDSRITWYWLSGV